MKPVIEYWARCHAHLGTFLLAEKASDEAPIRILGNTCPQCGRIPDRVDVRTRWPEEPEEDETR